MTGLDGHRDGVIWGVAVLGEQIQQPPIAVSVVADALFRQQLSGVVDECDVMVIFGPVESAVHVQNQLLTFSLSVIRW